MISVRKVILFWMVLVLTAVGAGAATISFVFARNEAAEFLDGQLRQIALNVGREAHGDVGKAIHQDPEDDFVIQVWNESGAQVRGPSTSLIIPRQAATGFSTIDAAGEKWRVYTSGDDRRFVQIGQRIRVRQEIAERAAVEAAAPVLVVIPLAWVVIGWALSRTFGRLDVLARAIAERGTDSKEPITVLGVPSELHSLVEATNVLIRRLQHALEQQRLFVSDAAHALRTPLTALHLQIENLKAAARPEPQLSGTTDLDQGIRRAEALVEQLLRLARFDAPMGPLQGKKIDLADIATECVAEQIPIASAKGVDLGILTREEAIIIGVPDALRVALTNLIDNAVRYTPEGGSVDVSVTRRGTRFAVEVADTGCGVDEKDLPRLFDRFFRSGPPHIEGNGLGLAIADVVAKRHNLEISVQNRVGGPGCIARLSGPRSA